METALLLPVLPGRREALVEFGRVLMEDRLPEYEHSQVTVTKESWHLHETSHGDYVVAYFEAADPRAVMSGLAESEEPFDVWFRDQVQSITGVDLANPKGSAPVRVFHWSRK